MRRLRALWLRVLGVAHPLGAEEDLAAELEAHLAMHIEDGVRAGLTEEQARRQALIRLGGMEQAKMIYRERRGLPVVETLAQDMRYAIRVLVKNPGFAAVVILTLGLGIGANTALFSVVHAVLLNPLPFPLPNELVTVNASKPNFLYGSISYLNFRDWQRDNHTLAALAVSRSTSFSLTGMGDTERVRASYVSSDFFPILGVKPAAGRMFAAGEDEIGRGPVAMISAGFWQRKFGSSPSAIGRALILDGRSFTIVGVLPRNFDLTLGSFQARDLYVPIGEWPNTALQDRGAGLGIHGIARLKPGVTLAQAQDDMNAVSDRLAAVFPEDDHGIRARLEPMRESMVGEVRPLLLLLLGAVGFILLIACVNMANLLLARSNARSQEFAVRFALGASRARILRQLLTESTLLSLAGGGLGLVLASVGVRVALKYLPFTLPRASEIHLDGTVLLFTLGLSLFVGIVFGLSPALRVSHEHLQDVLKEGGRGGSGAKSRVQSSLVVFEMAMALMLLAGAGVMIRSLFLLSGVEPGFQPKGVFTFSLAAPPSMGHESADAARAYYREVHRRMKEVPGVEGVSLSSGALVMVYDDEQLFWMENEPRPASTNDMHWALEYTVEPDYLNVMRIPLLRGRFFTDADRNGSPRVVVIDEVFAKKYFGGSDPVGQHLNLDGFDDKATVVGVAGHVLHWGLDSDASNSLRAQVYLPFLQQTNLGISLSGSLSNDVVVRVNGDGDAVIAGIERALQKMNREQVLWGTKSMSAVIEDTLAGRRFSMMMLALFAGLALLLASVGMYGVISYFVGQRRHEIGVRMALGADRSAILQWVLRQGGRLALFGAGAGLVGALALTELMKHLSFTYGVSDFDPWILGGVSLLLMAVSLLACYIPAARAMRVDPMRALRCD